MLAPWESVWPEWTCEKKIGQGSCGTVYLAVREENGVREESAVKVIRVPQSEAEREALRAEGMTEEETRSYYSAMIEDLMGEVRVTAKLKDRPEIVRIEDYAVEQDEDEIGFSLFIRMEHLTPLAVWLSDKTLSEEDVVRMGVELCDALAACHKEGILHRDVKPENIFVDDEGHFKLGDFGIAKQLEHATTYLTRIGTPFYIAPEVAASRRYGRRADIYSEGLVLYRLLNNGRLPFMDEQRYLRPSERTRALERRLSGEALPPPSQASDRMQKVLLKALSFEPEERYADAEEFRAALTGDKKSALPWWRKKWVAAAAAAVVIIGALGTSVSSASLPGSRIPAGSSAEGGEVLPAGESETETEPASGSQESSPTGDEASDPTAGISKEEYPAWWEMPTETEPAAEAHVAHTWSSWMIVRNATCTEDGKARRTCQVCGDIEQQTVPGGHNWGEWTVVREAGCTEEGLNRRICTVCGEVETEAIPATGHSWRWTTLREASCTETELRRGTCSFCGEEENVLVGYPLGHTWSSWNITKAATCTEAGTQMRTCEVCGTKQTQLIEALGHNYVNGICSRCDDSIYEFVPNADGKSYMLVSSRETSFMEHVSLPSEYKGLPVTLIKNGLFKYAYFGGGLTLPSKLSYIGEGTFYGATIAGTLVIPETVDTVATSAFSGAQVENIIISEGVKTLMPASFGLINDSVSVTVPSTVGIYDNAFASSRTVKLNVLTINSQTFLDSIGTTGSSLTGFTVKNIRLGSGISGYYVADGCLIRKSTKTLIKACETFTIPGNGEVEVIDFGPFYTDFNGDVSSSLYEVRIPEGVKWLGELAYTSSITNLYLPHSLQHVMDGSGVAGTTELTNIFYNGTMTEWTALVPVNKDSGWQYRPNLKVRCTDGVLAFRTDHWEQID